MVCIKVRKKIKYTINRLELKMENENLYNLILGIVKAILLFVFRLALLIPMLLLTIVGAIVGAGERELLGMLYGNAFVIHLMRLQRLYALFLAK